MDAQRHAGQTAIVTGAGSGIGRATVLQLAAEGARVIGCDVNAAGLGETQDLLAAQGLHAEPVTADITVQDDVEAVLGQVGGAPVDLLANVAGIMDHFAPLDEVTDELWANVLAVNLNGPMRLTRAVLPGMRERGTGSVVMVASEASLRGGTAGVAYTASKHALLGLVRHVAYFYGPQGIRCNAVLPGPVPTQQSQPVPPASQADGAMAGAQAGWDGAARGAMAFGDRVRRDSADDAGADPVDQPHHRRRAGAGHGCRPDRRRRDDAPATPPRTGRRAP